MHGKTQQANHTPQTLKHHALYSPSEPKELYTALESLMMHCSAVQGHKKIPCEALQSTWYSLAREEQKLKKRRVTPRQPRVVDLEAVEEENMIVHESDGGSGAGTNLRLAYQITLNPEPLNPEPRNLTPYNSPQDLDKHTARYNELEAGLEAASTLTALKFRL